MYDQDFIEACLTKVRNGISPEKIIRDTRVSRGTLYKWLRGDLPHKRYTTTYYSRNKEKIKTKKHGGNGIIRFEMDNYRCVSCGSERKIEIHHKDTNRKNNNINNLITLCKQCHTCLHWVLWHDELMALI